MGKLIKVISTVMSAIGLDLADVWSDWVGLDESGMVVRRHFEPAGKDLQRHCSVRYDSAQRND